MINDKTCKPYIGVNLEVLSDHMVLPMFADVMKTSRRWSTLEKYWDEKAQTDEGGWPIYDASVIALSNYSSGEKRQDNISGTYKLIFEGQATVLPAGGCTFFVADQTYSDGITTADVIVPFNEEEIMMSFTNTKNHVHSTGKGVRHVKLIRPGHYQSDGAYQTFNADFLRAIEPFSIIRFMDYLSTNDQNMDINKNEVNFKSWNDRRRPDDATQASYLRGFKGGCWEYMIELANLSKKDIWINIPVNATEDFIVKAAELLKQTLHEEIKLYVEYSNEVWNLEFPQTHYNLRYAMKDGHLKNLKEKANMIRFAERTAFIAKRFEKAFGSKAMNNRIRCVLPWQLNTSNDFDYMLEKFVSIYPEYGDPEELFYAFSIAPYFREPSPDHCTSIEKIHDVMMNSSKEKNEEKIQLVAVADKWKLKGGLIAYEGGPHHDGQVTDHLENRIAAHRDEGIKEIVYKDIKDNWLDLGCKEFVYYSLSGVYGVYGCWGTIENSGNLNHPKYQALSAISKTHINEINTRQMDHGLIVNPGFERGFEGWTLFNSHKAFSIDFTVSYMGKNSLRMTGFATYDGITQEELPVLTDHEYVLTFYTKGDNQKVSLCNQRTRWDHTEYSIETGNNQDWVQKFIRFRTAEDKNFFILIQHRYDGTTYFDHFKLVLENEIDI